MNVVEDIMAEVNSMKEVMGVDRKGKKKPDSEDGMISKAKKSMKENGDVNDYLDELSEAVEVMALLDKIRNEYTHGEYVEFITSGLSVGQLFMDKAYECMAEFDTMKGIFITKDQLDNYTKTDNDSVVIPTEPEGQEESTPDEELEQEQSIFKG